MKRVRIEKKKSRHERSWLKILSLDPRDPDVVRAKSLAVSGTISSNNVWGSKTPSRLRVARHCSFLDLVVFKRRLTAVHHDGVELERTPLLEHLERPVARPQRRVRVPPLQFFFEELLVMPGKPPGELVFIFDLNQVHGVLLVDLGQGQGVRGGGGIGGVDPIDERLFVPKDQGCSIEHDRSTGDRLPRSRAPRSRRPSMVLVDQPTEDLPPLDRPAPRGPRAWDRLSDIVRTAKTQPTMRSMRVVMRGTRTQDVHQVSSTQDQHVIEDLPPRASDQSLDVAVGLWGLVRGEHDLDAFGGENGIEAAAVLGVAVAEQEAHAELGVGVQIHHQVA